MAKKSYLVQIPSGICGNSSGYLMFDEGTWPGDSMCELKVNTPVLCKVEGLGFVVTNESKRIFRTWVIKLKPTKHRNHVYPVEILSYQKDKK